MTISYFEKDDYITFEVRASAAAQTAQMVSFWVVAITPEVLV